MQFIFLIWPILLLPVFVTWLTRPRPITPAPTLRRIAVKPAAASSPATRKCARQRLAAERRSNSPAYRRAAVAAYETMLALEMEVEMEDGDNDDASSHTVQLQGKDAGSSRS